MYGQVPLDQQYNGYAQPEPVAEFYVLTTFSTWFGLFAILTTAVVDIFQPEYGPLIILVHLMLVATTAGSVIYAAARWRDGLIKTAMPLGINLTIGLVLLCMPFARVWETASFRVQQSRYQYIAQQILDGDLKVDTNGRVTLPLGYRSLSDDGLAHVQYRQGATNIFFFADSHAGYMFRSDNSLPEPLFNGNLAWHHIESRAHNWYYLPTN
ncbi:MAG: hypothetical protein KDE51_24780 [Anaerolineales bacterium]|nr:hypothetical protein [Anaerolineales bacterium]